MHLICINNKIVARCADERFGIRVALFDPFFIPDQNAKETDCSVLNSFSLKLYDSNELKSFEGDKRFVEALLFYENAPDKIAVTVSKNGDIIAMAAANEISILIDD